MGGNKNFINTAAGVNVSTEDAYAIIGSVNMQNRQRKYELNIK